MDSWQNSLKQRLQDFLKEFADTCEKIGRKKNSVKIVFATKYLNREQFVAFLNIAREINMVPVTIGENRVQEAQAKFEFVKQTRPQLVGSFYPIMIGTLQKNKINKAINIFSEIHSVDAPDLAEALDDRLRKENRVMPIFLEVNISGEESKHGVRTDEIDGVIRELKLLKSLKIKGLMTMAPYFDDPEKIRPIFRTLRQLADRYQMKTSMGMSNDWKVAIEEGADMTRIGGRIFSGF